MQAAMDRLERLIARRRRLVLVAWLAIVVVSVPFAGRQTENLTGGGFETKGSGSKVVADALERDFGLQAEDLAVVFDNREGDPATLAAAFERVEREGFKDVEGVRLDPEAPAAARAASDADRDHAAGRRGQPRRGGRRGHADAREPRRRREAATRSRCTSSARARCGRASSSSPRRTSSRPRSSACRSC